MREFLKFLLASLLVFSLGCNATLPKMLPAPQVLQSPGLIRIDFPKKGQYHTTRKLMVRNEQGLAQMEQEIPVKHSLFVDVFDRHQAAKAYVFDGDADHRIVFEKFQTLPNRTSAPLVSIGFVAILVLPFGSALALVPWPDFASGHIRLNVLNQRGEVVETIEEKGRFWYCNWGPLLLTQFGRNRAQKLYHALNDRAAVRAITAIERDRAVAGSNNL